MRASYQINMSTEILSRRICAFVAREAVKMLTAKRLMSAPQGLFRRTRRTT
jgi:hypothetical protein